MLVCVLDEQHAIELHADIFGNPYYQYRTHVGEVASHIPKEWKERVDKWQRSPHNDCLRARGDVRWQAACQYVTRLTWEPEKSYFDWGGPGESFG